MAVSGPILGIDFGTSNSGAAYLRDGKSRLIQMAPGQNTLPSTFFFDFETRKTLMGEPANQALLNGDDGRFMRALKRVLGTPLIHQKRQILNERITLIEVISRFLRQIKSRAEAQSDLTFDRVIAGRPVVFHGVNDVREVQAEADLRTCFLEAGFSEITFLPEPEAAAIAGGGLEQPGEICLIVDIGGGTSDFSLFRAESDGAAILANHGVRIGGTDFDRAINVEQVMPLLGKGTELRKVFGSGLSPVPQAIFYDLATWEKISFLYTAKNRRLAEDMARMAVEPDKLNRLLAVLDHELGHELAFAVERGKIAANSGDEQSLIALDQIERSLSVQLPHSLLTSVLAPFAEDLRKTAQETLQMANLEAEQIDRVIYVGGSSLMQIVSDTMKGQFPDAQHTFTEVFTAVTDGLALASARN